MKVAITSSGDTPDAQIDMRFGRAKKFILFDTETQQHQVVDNSQNISATQGAGIQAAQSVVNLGAEAVITGHCGPKAFRALSAAGVKVYTGASGTIAQSIEQLQAGQLTLAEAADVDGHW